METNILCFVIGLAIGLFFVILVQRSYRNTLLLCAKNKSAEKLPDGKFYYLVSEKEYCEMLKLDCEDQRCCGR